MMSMTPVKRLVATTGETRDGKKTYQRVGTFFKRDDGTFAIKIDALPVGDWSGWVNLYDIDDKPRQQQKPGMVEVPNAAAYGDRNPPPAAPPEGPADPDDSIPF